ncbi:MAG: alpha-amylase/4-alpha-glucanotransferase domain-containing protein [Candidatus Margulisiibacteriota bacterium]
MKKVKFLFGIHCHQPVGNFEHVLDEAYEKSYLPFIQVMDAHPRIKFAVHYSGILYDWFLAKHPEFIDYLKKLVKRGQAEIMTAGYYEPIIPIIPDDDKLGQINMANGFIKEKFGLAPRGLWLTERIWEPHLPKVLAQTGIEYVTVDDQHFISAGISPDKLLGYYVTEEEGAQLKIFPISKQLRYLIPFKLPEETIKYLHSIATEAGDNAAILADDGEKFGVWPGTHKWVFEEGYLERLLTMLEDNSEWIESMTFAEYLESVPPRGRVYLPTASYFEMMEWSLPTESGKKLERIIGELKHQGKFEEYSQFFKGGFFRNFFVKYPEANNMHKKMLQVSQKLQTLKKGKSLFGEQERDARLQQAKEELYQGQCNCAYWHGVFGGLYLNYLRHAVYEHLIKAEVLMDQYARAKDDYAEIAVTDFDKDGQDEVILSNSLVNLYFAPGYGGALFELDYKPKAFNLINTLARREEVYHEKLKHAAGGGGHGVASIHDIVKSKEEGLEKALDYDWHRRISLLDHFLAAGTDLESFSRAKYQEVGDFTIAPYEYMPKRRGSETSLVLRRTGRVGQTPVKVEKEIMLYARQSIVTINYEVTNLGREKLDAWFGPEFNFSLLAGRSDDRYYELDSADIDDRTMASKGAVESVKCVKIVDKWKGFSVLLEMDRPATFWRFPIETVSQSESGFERTYQSSVVFPNWRFSLEPNAKWQVKIVLRIED